MSDTFNQQVDGTLRDIADSAEGHELVTIQNNNTKYTVLVYVGMRTDLGEKDFYKIRAQQERSFSGFEGKVQIKAPGDMSIDDVTVVLT